MRMEKFFEAIGVDLVPYAIGLSRFESDAPFQPTSLRDIREQVQSLDAKKLDDALEYSKKLLDEESSRGEKTESKAYNLIGVTGISAAFVTGISGLLPQGGQMTLQFSLILLLISYLLIVISLTLTVLLASRAVVVRSYTYPDIADVFRMNSQSLTEVKADRLATYMYCYAKNCETHNIKVSYLIGAQLWFRNSIVFFLVLSFILISNFLGGINAVHNTTGTPTSLVTLINTQSTMSVTATANSVSPTVQSTPTPSQTLVLPTSNSITSTPTP